MYKIPLLDYHPPEQRDTTTKDQVHQRLRDAVAFHLQRQGSRQNLAFVQDGLDIDSISQHIFPEDHSVRLLFDELGLEPALSHHWRALLEALAENFVEHRGAKYKLSNKNQYDLAADIYSLHANQVEGSKAPYQALADDLRMKSPYRDTWAREDRTAFTKRVERLVKSISPGGTIDHSFMSKAALRFRRPESDPRFEWPDEDADLSL